ncbi:triose-phosphate transporter family domain-containing protein [Trichoderma velutinum]
MTWFLLFLLSRSPIGIFVPRRAPRLHLIPLGAAMCFNVILPNLSLAYSTVTFYQIARILLTPTVAIMNFVLYSRTLPRGAALALIPACVGVGMVTYFDSIPVDDQAIQTTSKLGIIFAFSGIFASSLYTVWIAGYHRKLNMNSMQLLYLQAPMACFLLFFFIPLVDEFPSAVYAPSLLNRRVLIIASTVFASLVNISQFYIVAQTGPVSSTVVGHVKTCTIVGLGWAMSGRAISDKSAVGVVIAVAGITLYSITMLKHKKTKANGSKNAATGKM